MRGRKTVSGPRETEIHPPKSPGAPVETEKRGPKSLFAAGKTEIGAPETTLDGIPRTFGAVRGSSGGSGGVLEAVRRGLAAPREPEGAHPGPEETPALVPGLDPPVDLAAVEPIHGAEELAGEVEPERSVGGGGAGELGDV